MSLARDGEETLAPACHTTSSSRPVFVYRLYRLQRCKIQSRAILASGKKNWLAGSWRLLYKSLSNRSPGLGTDRRSRQPDYRGPMEGTLLPGNSIKPGAVYGVDRWNRSAPLSFSARLIQ